jgi:hypothetical protein
LELRVLPTDFVTLAAIVFWTFVAGVFVGLLSGAIIYSKALRREIGEMAKRQQV